MKEKNLPDDINKKSLDELTKIANQIITKLENTSDLETSIQDYQKLIKLNNFIESKFNVSSKEISNNFKKKIFSLKNERKIK